MSRVEKRYGCPVEVTVEAIGGKWKSTILWWLRQSAKRPSELLQLIPGLTQKVLTRQLRELESDGLIHRQTFSETPPRVEYSLTSQGEALRSLVELMADWGKNKLPNFQFGIVNLKDIQVLVIADEPIAQELKIALGVVCEATVTIVSKAITLEQLNQVQPDVVVVDFSGDSDDFTSLVRHVQQLEMRLARPTPAIALATSNNRGQAFSQGFRIVLTKPVETIELAAATASFTGRLG
ncbi:MAG: helix-turn-helix transcriptional regulator [Goleter apudmare HA4340-LM2]|jgi:DNA-binding HxlR family transcriptional regulator/CheY-like chemotaxis protein|nr:helix-turn-helix transcriptional regulator [Goleter apudmare HA4340-LM2]